jgi:uncharacterized protein YggE
MRRFMPAVLLALVLTAQGSTPAAAQSAADQRLLTVSAVASVRAIPDRAMVQLGVATEAATAQLAMADNSLRMQKIVDALLQVPIPRNSLQTSSIVLTPIYTNGRQGEAPKLVGYRASNTLIAELADLTRVGMAIDVAVASGANEVQGVSFRLSDELPFRREALQRAGQNALAKGQALALGLGITLVGIQSAQEVGYQVTPVNERAGAALDASTPVLPGELVIQSTVQVQFRIGP